MSPTKSAGPIQLSHDGGQVVVTPQDHDRFVMAAGQAVTACQAHVAARVFLERFQDDFLTRLFGWCEEHRDSVEACYVPLPPAACFKVFVIAKAQRFDIALSDEIASLELELDDRGWPSDILQIAASHPEEMLAFFDPDASIQVFGDGQRGATP